MKLFRKAAENIRNSPWIIPIYIVFLSMFIIAVGLMIEDYTTSLYGYQDLPTQKANDWVVYFVAALPQLMQIGFLYVFMDDTDKRWAIMIAGASYAVDVATDMIYKTYNFSTNFSVWVIAFIETNAIYTFGSEIMMTVSFGMLLILWPSFIKQFGNFVSDAISSGIAFLAVIGLNGKDEGENKGNKQDFAESRNEQRGRGRPKRENREDFDLTLLGQE